MLLCMTRVCSNTNHQPEKKSSKILLLSNRIFSVLELHLFFLLQYIFKWCRRLIIRERNFLSKVWIQPRQTMTKSLQLFKASVRFVVSVYLWIERGPHHKTADSNTYDTGPTNRAADVLMGMETVRPAGSGQKCYCWDVRGFFQIFKAAVSTVKKCVTAWVKPLRWSEISYSLCFTKEQRYSSGVVCLISILFPLQVLNHKRPQWLFCQTALWVIQCNTLPVSSRGFLSSLRFSYQHPSLGGQVIHTPLT